VPSYEDWGLSQLTHTFLLSAQSSAFRLTVALPARRISIVHQDPGSERSGDGSHATVPFPLPEAVLWTRLACQI
jgi:hypothetical protein